MSDLISREYMKSLGATCIASRSKDGNMFPIVSIDELPPADPTHPTQSNTLGALDCVDRRLVSYKLTDLVNEFEEILSHIREREENDSVCGLCEYDGAYMGQSGDWCNECPGFDKADCFKLKDKYKKEWLELMNTLPSVQSTTLTEDDKETIRIHLSAFKERLCNQRRWNEAKEYEDLITRILSAPSTQPRKGKWIDYSDEGYVECPFCHSATNCDGNKDELHYCFSCGAELR